MINLILTLLEIIIEQAGPELQRLLYFRFNMTMIRGMNGMS